MRQYLNINIPEPCHEDWNKMTPNAQGAFCGSCQKTVVDFSMMEDQQIKDYFLQKSDQKTCGRFNAKQLNKSISLSVPTLSSWKTQFTPLRKFAAALFLVFGTGLFSCTSLTGQPVGKVVIEQNNADGWGDNTQGEVSTPILIGDTLAALDEHDFVMSGNIVEEYVDGEVEVRDVFLNEGVSVVELIRETTKGEVWLDKPTREGPVQQVDTLNFVGERTSDRLLQNNMVSGGVSFTTAICSLDPLESESNDGIDSINERREGELIENGNQELALVVNTFPNPAKQFFNLKFDIPVPGKYKIQVVSIDGKQIRKESNAHYDSGTYVEYIDVSNLPSGVYFYAISSRNYSQSGRVNVAN
jgi:hypothetical protein